MSLTIYRSAVLPAFLFFLSVVSHPLQAQNVNWQVISNSTDAVGNTTIVERASSGQKRETKISYYPGTSNVWTQTQTDVFVTGAYKITHKAWTQNGTQREESYIIFEVSGTARSSDRWFIDSTGRRYFEKWDNERRGWVPVRSDDGPRVTAATRNKIRIRYAASRTADANLTFQKLMQKGFTPSLESIPEGEGQVFIRGLQFYNEGDADNANDIAQTLRDIEPLTPHFLGPASKNDFVPTDRHFDIALYAKKKPLVRIAFTDERRVDAESCQSALELRGFYVDIVPTAAVDIDKQEKGLIFYNRSGDKTVAESIPACLANTDEKLEARIRPATTGANPPDFHFVLTSRPKHPFHGVWKNETFGMLGVEVSENIVTVRVVTEGNGELWLIGKKISGSFQGNVINTTWEQGCLAEGWVPKALPARLTISADGKSLGLENVVVQCDSKGTMTVTSRWENTYGSFTKISDEVPTKSWK